MKTILKVIPLLAISLAIFVIGGIGGVVALAGAGVFIFLRTRP